MPVSCGTSQVRARTSTRYFLSVPFFVYSVSTFSLRKDTHPELHFCIFILYITIVQGVSIPLTHAVCKFNMGNVKLAFTWIRRMLEKIGITHVTLNEQSICINLVYRPLECFCFVYGRKKCLPTTSKTIILYE